MLTTLTRCALTCLALTSLAGCGGGSSSVPGTTATTGPGPATIVTVGDAGNTNVDAGALGDALADLPIGELSAAERAGLLLMREEEKLAGDVYRAMFDLWGTAIFRNIADSKDTHTAAMKALLDRYSIPDPVGDNGAGIFTDMDLQMLFDALTARPGCRLPLCPTAVEHDAHDLT